jgi:subtilisin family serine protease
MQQFLVILALAVCAMSLTIHPSVVEKLKTKGTVGIFVEMKEKLDFDALAREKGKFDDMEESYRGHLIMNSLQEIAMRTQKNVIAHLQLQAIEHESFWIDNKIAIPKSDLKLISQLEFYPEIAEIFLIAETSLDNESVMPVNLKTSQNEIEAGVAWVKAPQVWAKGVTGKGIVVGNSDTGSIIHNDFKNSYRGGNGTILEHNYNWFDAIAARPVPYDDHGHGTHCMGTKVGTSPTLKVGVAPGAQWIVCKWLNGGGGGNAQGALKCLQFFLAPTKVDGTQPNPDKRPHVTSHSYRCACNLENAVKALVAAGVEVVVAAGNSGPRCSTVTEPGHFASAYAVGALNRGSDLLASFSSKGPHGALIKPDISAPGAAVRSTSNRGSYVAMSGTSMACPHAAGVVALLWSGHSSLKRKIEASRKVLNASAKKQTSTECNSGGRTPNNVFGHGTIDALKAHEMAGSQ